MEGQPLPRNDQITRQGTYCGGLEGSTGLILQGLVESVPEDYSKNAYRVSRDLEFFSRTNKITGSVYRVVDRAGIKN